MNYFSCNPMVFNFHGLHNKWSMISMFCVWEMYVIVAWLSRCIIFNLQRASPSYLQLEKEIQIGLFRQWKNHTMTYDQNYYKLSPTKV